MSGQRAFSGAILDPDQPTPPGLSDPEGRPAGKRFDVYRNNVVLSLIGAAEDSFPTLRKLIGEQNFRVMAGAYARAHPPSSPLMMHYGQSMPTFLEGFEPLQAYPYMPDIARLELALRRSYHAADAAAIAPEALGQMAPDDLMAATVSFAPSVQLLRSPWPIHGIWAMNMAGGPKPEARAEDVLITRAEFDPEPHALPMGGGDFIETLAKGQTFGAALNAAGDGFDLSTTLGLLLQGNALTSLNERTMS